MIYLFLSIVFSTLLFVIFKYFTVFKIDTLKALVVNYFVALSLGFSQVEHSFSLPDLIHKPWFYGAIILGFMFVGGFFLMALTSQINGVSVASVAAKMSLVVPVFFGIILYDESLSYPKIIGIILVLIAIYLFSVKKKKETIRVEKKGLILPVLLFFGSGTIDTTLKYVEKNFVSENEMSFFSGSLFGFAAFFGMLIVTYQLIIKKQSFGFKNILAGIILGIPNYYSVFFLIKALKIQGLESSTLFVINNVGIVILSTLVGLFLFKEFFTTNKIIGFLLAIFGIFLVAITF